ncbi:uncharacterized protein N7443_001481 [Penicillium atrosanguineum]|uniref:uncharacterized protein n=1 Tax=Penicillium atrosanguineum TaxID=1132637 RepID=UPI00239B1835|nr:uncharacterized protein N7443_001481 [Penicillium atrosanguineum]KAJ5314597.1 hypothetical protein N7443_001481 [Penicillium atrosanguineum]
MPHLRRQPNPHDFPAPNGPSAPGSLRAQFQTPPSRQTPSNPTRLHASSTGPQEITPDPTAAIAHPAAQSDFFSIFSRPRLEQQPPPVVDEEDVLDDDFDPNAQDMEPDEEFEEDLIPEDEDQLEPEDDMEDSELVDEEELDEEVDDGLEDDQDEEMHDREKSPSPLPPNLREISSLASWTVSTSKPGCGVAALRHPSPSQYWQSDGPQPHTLTLHFFKLVAVVRIRVYLDFELDESYTPTKMIFLAGMGGNDLVEFGTWEGDGPCGWVDVPLEGVGGRNGGWVRDDAVRHERKSKGGSNEEAEDDDEEPADEDPYAGNVLKAMVIQMRIMENHQNGKDTHVRGFQVFACDDSRRRMAGAPSASADGRRRRSMRQSLRGNVLDALSGRRENENVDTGRLVETSGLEEPDWMGEPVIR